MNDLIEPLLVQARPNYHIYLEFSDGTKGEVDLSALAGQGVFKVWSDYDFFKKVHIGQHREIKDRKSTRLNSSHSQISYAVFCLKKKKKLSTVRISTHSVHVSSI